MAEDCKEISLKKFLNTFKEIHDTDIERKFCFVLGAGASVSSGIPTGATLAKKWLDEIKSQEEEADYNKWLLESEIDSTKPELYYPKIYQKRYENDPKSGFTFIEGLMAGKTPSYGYSVLAQILATTRHNVVITTNFDDLLQEALYTYTNKRPLVCGHESLAGFAKARVDRPLIIKIHRDRFLSPINDDQTAEMKEQWLQPLSSIFSTYTPIFIGYGGNDGSLMHFLNNIREFENIFWIEREGKTKVRPNDLVNSLLSNKNGKLIYSQGFDDLMFLLQDELKLPLLKEDILRVAKERQDKYIKEVEEILKRKSDSGSVDEKAIAGELYEKAKDWWHYDLKARAAKTNEEKNSIYLDGIKQLPNSIELIGNYAIFLNDIRKDYDTAEKYYLKSLSIDPESATNNGNYANFLYDIRKDYDTADKYYLKALSVDPENANNNGNYAVFLNVVHKDYDNAERYYLKALSLHPENANYNSNYAYFLIKKRNDLEKARPYILKAIENDNKNGAINDTYAIYLCSIGEIAEAKKHHLIAVQNDPDSIDNNINYANYLRDHEKDYLQAEKYYKIAFEIDNTNEELLNEYELFLSLRSNKG